MFKNKKILTGFTPHHFSREKFNQARTTKNGAGFTLIELLVVISIIGLLASLILVNVKDSRAKAHDAHAQSLMHQVRNAAEMSCAENNESYTQVCDESDNTLSDAGEFGILEKAIKKDNGGKKVSCFVSADEKDFAAASPLVARQGKYWCVESAGLSVELDHDITSAKCQ